MLTFSSILEGCWCVISVFVLCQVISVCSEKVLGVETDDFDFDGLPGAHHEFKVDVAGHSEQCFFQSVAEGANLYVSFEVLRGGDGLVDFYVRDMQWKNIDVKMNQKNDYYSMQNARAGTYAICVDNPRYGAKFVFFFISSFIMQEWTDFQKEINEIHTIARNFTDSIDTVHQNVNEMYKSQANARFHVVKDWYLLNSNYNYVYYWSMAQCILIVLSAFGQVYTVRRLFRSVKVTPTHKPRA